MKKAPEKNRIVGEPHYGNNGVFAFKHPKIIGYVFICQISDGLGWEHVSVTLQNHANFKKPKPVHRCPTWEEMCYVKDLFFEEEETAVQFHPPKSEWVSTHPYCLHLWKPINYQIITPPVN